ncbi:MAG: acyl-CoA/acyl-ACP dehydrogenase [Candidatus Tectomicrobia bacterium]|nr:acyl-CoA/acyl-ACP dehydrogenase [Candidatus Tectomicrobia bacterium]
MDFAFSEQQEMMRRTLHGLLGRVCPPEYAMECDRKGEAPVEAYLALARDGWVGVSAPEAYGGMGGSALDLAIVLETAGMHYLDLATVIFRNVCYGCEAVLISGTEKQKAELVPATLRGEAFVAFSLTEPEAGSDAAAIITRAEPDGDHFRVTGVKNFTSGMPIATHILVATRTGDSGQRHEGITNFLLPAKREGVTWKKLPVLGHRAMGTSVVYYERVLAREDEVLGGIGQGWKGLMAYLNYERLCLSAARTGAAAAALDLALSHARERRQFGRPIGSFQAVSHMLAEMHVLVDTARLQVYRFAWLASQGKAGRLEAATLKLYAGEAYKRVADLGVQVMGGYGYIGEAAMERHYRDARLATIGAGTSEVQRNIIAKAIGL